MPIFFAVIWLTSSNKNERYFMDLIEEYRVNTESFTELIQSITDEQFNTKPNDFTWSVAENVEHIIRSEFGTARLFNSATKKDPERDSEAIIKKMKSRFLDRSKTLQAFGALLPTEGDKAKKELLQKFEASRNQVTELIQTQDMDELCMLYKHPLLGHMTRREWVSFNIVHTHRHMEQIKESLENFH